MKTTAAVLWERHGKWEVEEVELDGPKQAEVMVQMTATGLCRTDDHLITGDIPMPLPAIGGHEGAGVVVEVGPGVTDVAEGDHVVLSFIPACGRCAECANGMSNLCVQGAAMVAGPQLDGTYRVRARGRDVGQMCLLGTFAEHTVVPASSVVVVGPEVPLDKAALVGCGVTTGYGSVIRTGEIGPGDTVVVMGVGGIGINAVQGARLAGAGEVIALDPVAYKRTRSHEFGATRSAATVDEAFAMVFEITRGKMADACVICTDIAEGAYVAQALSLVGKRGRVVVIATPHPTDTTVAMSLVDLAYFEKQVRGALFGSCNPRYDIPRILDLYAAGHIKLDELITREYALDAINQGYADLRDGVNLRGMIRF